MDELKTEIVLNMLRLVEEPYNLVITIPEREWELEGVQPVALLNAAFEEIANPSVVGEAGDEAPEVRDEEGVAPVEWKPCHIETLPEPEEGADEAPVDLVDRLLEYRDECFAQLRLFSMAEVLEANVGSELVGIGFGINDGLMNPLFTVLYWEE